MRATARFAAARPGPSERTLASASSARMRRRASGCEEYRAQTKEPGFPYPVEVVAANDINDGSPN